MSENFDYKSYCIYINMPTKKQLKRAVKLKRKIERDIAYPLWTASEKLVEIMKIKEQLVNLGLSIYEDEMKKFGNICQAYIKEGVECCDKIRFPNSKRVLVFIFKNSSRYKISSQLIYDQHV